MEPFDRAQAFIELALTGNDFVSVRSAFELTLEQLNFRFFAFCSRTGPAPCSPGALLVHNYPQEWEWEFFERQFHQIDPVLTHAERTSLPFRWDSAQFLSALDLAKLEVLNRAATFGLSKGITLPIHVPWLPRLPHASFSLVPACESLGSDCYLAAQLSVLYFYKAAYAWHEASQYRGPTRALSDRERQCLDLVARGKSDWAIGQILKISEHTVHYHIERAKKRLGVSTRLQAILCALDSHQISLGDVIRSGCNEDDRELQ